MKSIENCGTATHPRIAFLEWYHTSATGKLLQQCEAEYLLSSIKLTYNQKILQVGRLGSELSYINEDYRNNFVVTDNIQDSHRNSISRIVGFPEDLPIANESIDFMVLPHLLEFADNPQQILREAERILKPEGILILMVLNPWSIRGIVRRFPHREEFKAKHHIACFKVMDWLKPLKFEAEFSAGFGLASSQTIFKPDSLLTKSMAQLASAYAVKAIKRTFALTPAKPAWIHAPTLVPSNIIETPSPLMRKPWKSE